MSLKSGPIEGRDIPLIGQREIDRLERMIFQEPNTGCWLWAGAASGKYAQFRIKGVQAVVHRVVYTWLVGAIPKQMTLDHLCRNTLCVNPNHLEVVSMAENLRRASNSISTKCSNSENCPKGHPYFGANLYINPRGDRECRRCRNEAYKKYKSKCQ
jgi:hypothetical protein